MLVVEGRLVADLAGVAILEAGIKPDIGPPYVPERDPASRPVRHCSDHSLHLRLVNAVVYAWARVIRERLD